MSSLKRFPFWLEITLLVGLAVIFAITYLQFKDSQSQLRQYDIEKGTTPPK